MLQKVSTRSEAKVLTATNSFTKIPTLDHPIGSDSIGESSQLFNSADVTASIIDVGRSSPEDSLVVKIQSSTKPEVIPQKQELPESQGLLEVEAKRKIQEAWKNRESVRMQFDHTEGAGEGSQLSGYITIQGGGCCFWKRRWFVLKGETLYFYRDPLDRYPVSCLDLGGAQVDITDSSLETLIPHCFKLSLRKDAKDEVYQMFSDSDKQKSLAVAGILECTKG
ncbi:hypothetical protein DSO57_1035343 [Entomophthora muscae]|uniref:Uncharacterized protein n=1 Tax=Entomophthora muscae TaxID=34485 RepID=A0ACC2REF1_9FUNG|nr:hypothetical protein DSO57_1035343 [Entomophthora muscae]